MKHHWLPNGCWFQNLKLPHRGGGYKAKAFLKNIKNNNNPYDWGAPQIGGGCKYIRTIIIKNNNGK